MCTTKAPKPQPAPEKKPVQYLSSPWVDGLGIVSSGARGRNSLRIDRGTPRVPVHVQPPPTQNPAPRPGGGGGGRGGGGYYDGGSTTGGAERREPFRLGIQLR